MAHHVSKHAIGTYIILAAPRGKIVSVHFGLNDAEGNPTTAYDILLEDGRVVQNVPEKGIANTFRAQNDNEAFGWGQSVDALARDGAKITQLNNGMGAALAGQGTSDPIDPPPDSFANQAESRYDMEPPTAELDCGSNHADPREDPNVKFFETALTGDTSSATIKTDTYEGPNRRVEDLGFCGYRNRKPGTGTRAGERHPDVGVSDAGVAAEPASERVASVDTSLPF